MFVGPAKVRSASMLLNTLAELVTIGELLFLVIVFSWSKIQKN
jgi:hypothetical protein